MTETHEHCPHVAGAPFAVNAADHPGQQIVGQALMCCQCGTPHVKYVGIVETGHGPFVSYEQPILLPEHIAADRRRN